MQKTLVGTMASFVAKLNAKVQTSFVGRYFLLEERGSNFTTDLNGAFSTFMSMGKNTESRIFCFLITGNI